MGKSKYLIITLGLFSVSGVSLVLYLLFGCSYSGTEFSPDDFSIRHFSYRYEPVTDWVISGRKISAANAFGFGYYGDSLPDLVGDNYIKPVVKAEKTWHLVGDNGAYDGDFSSDSDARFLVEFLKLRDQNDENKWTAWNSEHPKLATALWPFIAEMARDELYLTVSDVLTFALDSEQSDPVAFKAELQKEVAQAYLKVGRIDFENSDFKSAEYRVKKSIKFDSNADAKSLLNSIQAAKLAAE